MVTSKKKKKKVYTHIETVFLSSARDILLNKLAKRHEIAQKYETARNFDAKSPKINETAQNFARNLDTLHQPGGPLSPRLPHLLRLCLKTSRYFMKKLSKRIFKEIISHHSGTAYYNQATTPIATLVLIRKTCVVSTSVNFSKINTEF